MRMFDREGERKLFKRDEDDRFLAGFLMGIGVGALVGGVAALLATPKTGKELRQSLGDTGRRLVHRAEN